MTLFTTITKAIVSHLLFGAAPLLVLILANFLVEPDRAWFTGLTQTQELGAWAALAAWSFFSLRLFIVPLERVQLGGAK